MYPTALTTKKIELRGVGLSGVESKQAETHLAGYSRGVTPSAFIHRRVRPLDGWMVVANPYHPICITYWILLGISPTTVPPSPSSPTNHVAEGAGC